MFGAYFRRFVYRRFKKSKAKQNHQKFKHSNLTILCAKLKSFYDHRTKKKVNDTSFFSLFLLLPVVDQHLVAKRSYASTAEDQNRDNIDKRIIAENQRHQIFDANSQTNEDSEFLELWADDEFENNNLFADNRETCQKPPPKSQQEKKSNETVTRPLKGRDPQSAIKSEVHRVEKRTTSVNSKSNCDEQFIRRPTSCERHSSIRAYKIPLRKSPQRLVKVVPRVETTTNPSRREENKKRRISPERPANSARHAAKRTCWKRDQETQTASSCNNCKELIVRLTAAEQRIKELEKQLQEANKPCIKCNSRTKQRNIRNRNKQAKYKEFFRANANHSAPVEQTNIV